MTHITLIRHGETDWNLSGRWQGFAPVPLNAHGIAQVQKAASSLKTAGISRIVSSDLLRARQTADIIAQTLAVPVELDARWREVDLGRWQGLTVAEIRTWDQAAYQAYEAQPYIERVFPDGETKRQHLARTRTGLEAIVHSYPQEHILAATHIGSIRCVVYHVTGESIDLLGNCFVTRLHFDDQVQRWEVLGIAQNPASVTW
jgi:broad specificity phosphatase PhoE